MIKTALEDLRNKFYLSRKLVSIEKPIPLQKIFHEKSIFMKIRLNKVMIISVSKRFFTLFKGLIEFMLTVNLHSNFIIRLLFAKIQFTHSF